MAHINLFEAWQKCAGDNSVVVSVHDLGVDFRHPDLEANIWRNESEINGTNGQDSDFNGYVDDKYGYNFASNTGYISAGNHGTHVAGTISAVNNNGIGGAGVAGGSGNDDGVRIMSCQIFDGNNQGGIGTSFVYAADNGAVISQNSWGYPNPGVREESVEAGIRYFIEEAGRYEGSPLKGGIVIFASGNSNMDAELYPGYMPEVLTVAAIHNKEEKASYSNYGNWINVSAPGGDMDYDELLTQEEKDHPMHHGIFSTLVNGGYGWLEGTSMATPHVTGIAALAVSHLKDKNLTNSDLFSILEGSVDNVYGDTPEDHKHYNKLGAGRINALYALDEKTNSGPAAITDLSIKTNSQDLFELEFTVPVTVYGRQPKNYEVYFSKTMFGDSDLGNTARQVVEQNQLKPGEVMVCEANGLLPLTAYYLGVVSVDKWGNKSLLSNVVEGQTTAGPEALLEVNYTDAENHTVEHNIDVKSNTSATGQFILHNKGEGILNWVTNIDFTTENNWSAPIPGLNGLVYSNDASEIHSQETSPYQTIVEYNQIADTALYKGYLNASSYYFIGEASPEDPSSSATRFRVQSGVDGNGFNLTHIAARLNVDLGDDEEIIVEIFEGRDIHLANLRHRQALNNNTLEQTTKHALTTQLYFEEGTYFWVVLHPPTGHKYPLAIAFEEQNGWGRDNCYYSPNYGQTWNSLADVYIDGFAYMVEAISYFSPGNSFITLPKDDGRIYADEQETVTYTIDASKIINGVYNFDVNTSTNDAANAFLNYRLKTSIDGHEPVISGTTIIDFGRVMIGKEKHLEAYITNAGLGNFVLNRNERGDNTKELEFNGNTSNYKSPQTIEALSSVFFNLGYKPSQPGAFDNYIRFYNSNGAEEYTIKVTGYAINPPVGSVTPADTIFNDIAIGDELSGSFTIENSGDYPLHYYVPKFTDRPGDFDSEEVNFSKFGYFSEEKSWGPWEDISTTGTVIPELTTGTLDRKSVHEVELNFGFPFFGKVERKVYISPFCLLAFTKDGTFNQFPMAPLEDKSPSRAFCAMGEPFIFEPSIDSKIIYQDFGDHFIVQYQDMPLGSLDEETLKVLSHKITIQLVLYKNGNMEVRYHDLDGFPTEFTRWWSVWAHDLEQNDAIIANYFQDRQTAINQGTNIKFINPGLGLFKTVSKPAGVLLQGESVNIEYTMTTDILNEDAYTEYLPILSNEPGQPFFNFKADINVTDGGEANINTQTELIDFGNNFHLSELNRHLLVRNDGRAPGIITNISFTGTDADKFELITERVFPYELKAELIETFIIKALSDEVGEYNAILELTLNDTEVVTIPLHNKVIEAPLISLDKASVDASVMSGEETSAQLTITNTGLSNLEYGIKGTAIVHLNETGLKSGSGLKDFQYQHFDQNNNPNVIFEWTDISSTGIKLKPMDLTNHDNFWNTIELPWTFNYYGNDYEKMYVGYCGVLSFTEHEESYVRGGIPVPSEEGPNNIIAPMFGFVYNDLHNDKNAGIYYQEFEDEVIVQYQSFTDGMGMSTGPMSWQVILRQDGSFKFQYNFQDELFSMNPALSAIGLENETGTEGVKISFNSSYINDDTAIEFYPFEKEVLAPNESATHTFIVDASEVYAGEYTETVTILNNTVANGMVNVPFNISVDGNVDLDIAEEYNMGEIFVVEEDGWVSSNSPEDESWVLDFELNNQGRKNFRIGKIFTEGLNGEFGVDLYAISNPFGAIMVEGFVDASQLPSYTADWFNPKQIPLLIPAEDHLAGRVYLKKNPTEVKELTGNIVLIDYAAVEGMSRNELLNLQLTDIADEYKVSISFNANQVDAPSIELDRNEITAYALDDSFVGSETLNISNVNGKHDLSFSLNINYEYVYMALTDNYSAGDFISYNEKGTTAGLLQDAGKVKSKRLKAAKESRVLTQLLSDEVLHTFGWGADDAEVHTVTRLVAPENGFCFNQLEHYFTYRNTLESYYTVQVFAGDDDFLKTGLIFSQRVNYSYDAPLYGNQVVKELVDLEKPVMIQGGETFYIRIIYAEEMISPSALGRIAAEDEDGNLFGSKGIVYREISQLGVPEIGWMIKAIETEQIDPQWLMPSVYEGVVKPGESMDVEFTMYGTRVFNTSNKAKVYINSNDPNNKQLRVSAELIKNNGPSFGIDQNFVIEMNENDTLDFTLYASHYGGLDYTLSLAEDYPFVSGEFDGQNMKLQFTPDYFSAGLYRVVVDGVDSKGLTNSYTFIVRINNVNRAPVVIQDLDFTYHLDKHLKYNLDLTEYIADPDGEELTFTVIKDNDNIELFYSNHELIIKPLAIGNTILTIQAEDPNGSQLVTTANIEIVVRVGIDDVDDATISIFPNPVKDVLNIKSNMILSGDVNYRILSVTGEVVKNGVINSGNLSVAIEVASLKKGLYMLELSSDKVSVTNKFTKL